MNVVVLIGRLTKDPESKTANSGNTVTSFRVAVDAGQTTSGEKETDYFDVKTFGKTAENCAKYLAKGREVAINGKIRTYEFTTQNGDKRKGVEIIADRVKFGSGGQQDNQDDRSYAQSPSFAQPASFAQPSPVTNGFIPEPPSRNPFLDQDFN